MISIRALFFALICWPAFAQVTMTGAGLAKPGTAAVFSGVADQQSSITICGGLKACSLAVATAHAAAVDLSNNSSTCTGVPLLTNGKLDVSSATSCTGSTTVAGICAGICTAANGTWRVMKIYFQIGSGSWTAASYAVAPFFVLSTINSEPAALCVSANSTYMTATVTSIPNPSTQFISFARTAGFTGFGDFQFNPSGTTYINGGGAANTVQFGAATTLTATAADATGNTDFTAAHWHNVAGQQNAAGNLMSLFVDGAAPTTVAEGFGVGTGATLGICGNSTFADAYIRLDAYDPTAPAAATVENATNPSNVGL